jgi:hypothetical protein
METRGKSTFASRSRQQTEGLVQIRGARERASRVVFQARDWGSRDRVTAGPYRGCPENQLGKQRPPAHRTFAR